MNKKRLVKELEGIVGRGMVVHHPDDLLVFEYDGSVDRGVPTAVVFPENTDEVSRVVSLAYREGVPVVPRGASRGWSTLTFPTPRPGSGCTSLRTRPASVRAL